MMRKNLKYLDLICVMVCTALVLSFSAVPGFALESIPYDVTGKWTFYVHDGLDAAAPVVETFSTDMTYSGGYVVNYGSENLHMYGASNGKTLFFHHINNYHSYRESLELTLDTSVNATGYFYVSTDYNQPSTMYYVSGVKKGSDSTSPSVVHTYPVCHITKGQDQWEDTLAVDNLSGGTYGKYTIKFYDETGTYKGKEDFQIGPLDYEQHNIKSLNPFAASAVIETKYTCLNFRMSYMHENEGAAEFNLKDIVSPALSFNFSNAYSSIIDWKGMAIMNMGEEEVEINMYAVAGSTVIAEVKDTLQPYERKSGYHSSWFNAAVVQTGSLEKIIVTSLDDTPLTGITISGDIQNTKLLFTQAQPAPGISMGRTKPLRSGTDYLSLE